MDEDERIEAVRDAHERTRSPVGANPIAHASIHVMVEDRLAAGHPSIVAAYDRFRAAGASRHVTVHALASVVTRHMMATLERQAPLDDAAVDRDFEALDPAAFVGKR